MINLSASFKIKFKNFDEMSSNFVLSFQVQGNTVPPVCKLMDFHKEKYQKKLRDKDRAKIQVLHGAGVINLSYLVENNKSIYIWEN